MFYVQPDVPNQPRTMQPIALDGLQEPTGDQKTIIELLVKLNRTGGPYLKTVHFKFLELLDAIDELLHCHGCSPRCETCNHLHAYWVVIADLSSTTCTEVCPLPDVREKHRWFESRFEGRRTKPKKPCRKQPCRRKPLAAT